MKPIIAGLWVAAGVILAGCETPGGAPNNTGTGALAGGGIGAASGAVIGAGVAGRPGEGALIGGAVGAVTGGLIGYSLDERQRAQLQTQSPETYNRLDRGEPLGIEDIKALSRAGVSDDVIISQIQATHTIYHLI